MKYLKEKYVLSNGVEIPKIGFGTWQIPKGNDAYKATLNALNVGYIHIDTAFAYDNEFDVGRALKDSGLKRENVFITSKLPSHIKDYNGAIKHMDETIKNLSLDYVDLYLIHAPWPWNEIGKDCKEGNLEVWKAIIEYYEKGYFRAIGVSNFNKDDIKYIVDGTGFMPHVNQIKYHIGFDQSETIKYCNENNILVEAYSPLGTGKILNDSEIINMANKYNVTPAQLCIKFCIDNNTLPLPKTVNKNRMIENANVDFKISESDLEILNKIQRS